MKGKTTAQHLKKIKLNSQHISTSDQDGVTGTGLTLVYK